MNKKEKLVWVLLTLLVLVGLFYIFNEQFNIHTLVVYTEAEGFSGDVVDFSASFDEDMNSFALTGDGSIMNFSYASGKEVGIKANPKSGRYVVECLVDGSKQGIGEITLSGETNFSIPYLCQNKLDIVVTYFSEEQQGEGDNEKTGTYEEAENETIMNQTNITSNNDTIQNQSSVNETQEGNESIV
ncbi:MAG: hypothetical protein ACP5D2_01850, partial [Candidatus Nanoarchaeia archaeon]